MIQNDLELAVTRERITRFQTQVAYFRKAIADTASSRLMAGGWLAEIDKMQREVKEYLRSLPEVTVAC